MKRPPIFQVGLTGGIGCGKSAVRRMVSELGFPTIDVDTVAKNIAVEDAEAIAAIKKTFGEEVYDKNGGLQRKVLAAKVFGDRAELAKLNKIVHPRVFVHVNRLLAPFVEQGRKIAVIEAALFYESGWDHNMDKMAVVTAPMEKRLAWAQARDNSSEAEIRARMAHQIPVEEKAKRADYVIENDGSLEELREKVSAFMTWVQEQIRSSE